MRQVCIIENMGAWSVGRNAVVWWTHLELRLIFYIALFRSTRCSWWNGRHCTSSRWATVWNALGVSISDDDVGSSSPWKLVCNMFYYDVNFWRSVAPGRSFVIFPDALLCTSESNLFAHDTNVIVSFCLGRSWDSGRPRSSGSGQWDGRSSYSGWVRWCKDCEWFDAVKFSIPTTFLVFAYFAMHM